jgi:DNA helicase TIP49 (TBP-interacting protein)
MTNAHRIALLTLALAVPGIASAQPAVSKSNTIRGTATIQAIDKTTRAITLKTKDGEETFRAGPDMTRFNELKVGDTIDVTYIESVVLRVRKPGETATATTGDVALTRSTGTPGGTLSTQVNTTVTVKAIDPSVPSITVVTEDGRTVSRKVEDKKNLEGVKVGDKIGITYTEALLVSVAPTK